MLSLETSELIINLKKVDGIVAISQFGSYGTKHWIKDRSDIDLLVIVEPHISYLDTLDMEDKLLLIFEPYYSYSKIHFTFILFKDFYSKFARIAIDSDTILILNDDMWFDFQHYVLKHIRNNKDLEQKLRLDEQYSYFGGIIDESLL